MIQAEVNLQPFCNNCEEFDPNVFTTRHYADNKMVNYYVSVRCKNEKHCYYLYNQLKKETKDEQRNS